MLATRIAMRLVKKKNESGIVRDPTWEIELLTIKKGDREQQDHPWPHPMLALAAPELGQQYPRQGAADVGPGEAHHDGNDEVQGQN